jgi:DNA-directed RNA polymerase subunit RPC12/RpoP
MVEIAEKINCPDCGAPLKLEAGEVIITCEYCGSAINMAVGKKFFFKHSIIPNNYTLGEMEGVTKSWMQKGFLKPDDLARKSKIQRMELIFLPFFIVHVHATSKYSGVLTRTGQNISKDGKIDKEYYWKILGRRASTFPTKEYEIPLKGKVNFNLSRISKGAKFLNSEMDEKEAESLVKQEINTHHRYLLSTEIDVINDIDTTMDIKNIEFVHAPVWFIKYTYRGKQYEILIDGASGEDIKADIPTSSGIFGKIFGR